MARLYGTRPSRLMDVRDPYTAYCVDEAAAWLLGRQEAPERGKAVFNRPEVARTLAQHGGARIKGKEAESRA